ncbi:MAG: tetratricopeptide repeat protein [Deltaproteobacteria bacterium]|nr:tetratricopeptide repeat protein [Deltaproteobacteria bacterium]
MANPDKQAALTPAAPEEPAIPAEPVPADDAPLTVGELVDGAREMIGEVSTAARRLVDRGRYRKLRISRRGKPLLPDIPLAAVAAIEAASIVGGGVARALAMNVGAKLLFDVDVINEADKFFERGKEALLDGDLDRAEEALLRAARIDDTHAGAFLQLGVLCRLRGEPDRARECLARAKALDPTGETGKRAEAILTGLDADAGVRRA